MTAASAKGALPRSSWSAVSPCGGFFASACLPLPHCGGAAVSEVRRSVGGSTPRCKVRVWRSGRSSSGGGDSGDVATSGKDGLTLEFQKQFLGQTISHLAFVETAQDGASRRSASRLLLLVGSDTGMVACLDCTGGGELLFTKFLGRAASEEVEATRNPTEAALVAAAAGGFPVCGFAFLANGRQVAVLIRESSVGSSLHVIKLPSGEIASHVIFKKPFSAVASLAPSCVFSSSLSSSSGRSLEDPLLVFASSGVASGASGSLSIWSASQQRVFAKLNGAGAGVSVLTASGDCGFVAALTRSAGVSTSQHQHIAIWKVGKDLRLGEGGAAAKKARVQPWAILAPPQRVAHLMFLPSASFAASIHQEGDEEPGQENSSETEVQQQKRDFAEDGAADDAVLVALSEGREILVWALASKSHNQERAEARPRLIRLQTFDANQSQVREASEGAWFIGSLRRVPEKHRRKSSTLQLLDISKTLLVARGDTLSPTLQLASLRRVLESASDGQKFFLPNNFSSTSNDETPSSPSVPLALEEWRTQCENRRAEDETPETEDEGREGRTLAPSEALLSLKRGTLALSDHATTHDEEQEEGNGDDDDEKQEKEEEDGEGNERKRRKQLGQRQQGDDSEARSVQAATLATRAEGTSVGAVVRQAVATGDLPMLESVLSGSKLRKKEIANAVSELSPSLALRLLQLLVEQHRQKPSTSIFKGPWMEEVIRCHAVSLASQPEGRRQLVLLQHILQRRRRAEDALIRLKGRTELLLQCMDAQDKQQQQRRLEREEAMQPLVEFTADS